MTKNQAGEAIIENTTLKFSSGDKIDPKYATEISIVISTLWDPSKITGLQNGNTLPSKKIAKNRFVLNANPVKGNIILSLTK